MVMTLGEAPPAAPQACAAPNNKRSPPLHVTSCRVATPTLLDSKMIEMSMSVGDVGRSRNVARLGVEIMEYETV